MVRRNSVISEYCRYINTTYIRFYQTSCYSFTSTLTVILQTLCGTAFLWVKLRPEQHVMYVTVCVYLHVTDSQFNWLACFGQSIQSVGWSSKLLLALANALNFCFGSRWDPWPCFCSKTCTCFEMGPPLRREEGSNYYWSLPLYWSELSEHSLTVALLHTNTLTHTPHSTAPGRSVQSNQQSYALIKYLYCQDYRKNHVGRRGRMLEVWYEELI
jgi:hypothetical protein